MLQISIKNKIKHFGLLMSLGSLVACSVSNNSTPNIEGIYEAISTESAYSNKAENNIRISLVDAPKKELSSVHINIDRVELIMHKDGKNARLILAENFGRYDLMKFQNGLKLLVNDLHIPAGTNISQIRIILKEEEHFATTTDGSVCDMKTPSATKSGVKILLGQNVNIENNKAYSLVVDFDVKKSVVIRGNSTCLLKPVLKVASFKSIDKEKVDDSGNPVDESENDLTNGQDWSNDSNTDQGYTDTNNLDCGNNCTDYYPEQLAQW